MHIDLREYDDAVNCLEKQIAISESFSFMPSIIRLFQTSLMRAKVLRHDQDIEINELFTYYQINKLLWCKGWMARNIGDILLHIDNDNLSDAGVWFQKAIEADTKNGFRWQLAMDHACYADWFKKKGDIQGAKEQLTKAIDIFRECGADGWVTRTEQELAAIS
jgi:tetratricopeptide (TPR) repeat protein